MTTSVFSNAFGNSLLAMSLCANGAWLALHVGDPGPTGTDSGATELAGGGYERQRITFAAPSGRACVSNNKQVFTGVPASRVTYLVLWDSPFGGTFQVVKALPAPISPTVNAHFLCAAGDFAVQL